jgi:hypothetical protein
VYCALTHRSRASANRDISSGLVESCKIHKSRLIIAGSIRRRLRGE